MLLRRFRLGSLLIGLCPVVTPALAQSGDQVIARLPATEACSDFRTYEWPGARRSNEQRPHFVEIFSSMVADGSKSAFCQEPKLVDRRDIERYWRRNYEDRPPGSLRGHAMETWWYYGRLCMADICESTEQAAAPQRPAEPPPPPPPAPAPPPAPPAEAASAPAPVIAGTAPPPSPPAQQPAMQPPPAQQEHTWSCTCVITGEPRSTTGRFDVDVMTRMADWPAVAPFYRTGLAVGVTTNAKGTDRDDWWAKQQAWSKAYDEGGRIFEALRERVRQSFYPDMELVRLTFYSECRHENSGRVEIGSSGQPPQFAELKLTGIAPQYDYSKGSRTFPNGARYTGDLEGSTPHGSGVLQWPDGARYEGDFVRGRREGQGSYYDAQGVYYEGSWKSDRENGRGTRIFANGAAYHGDWRDGVPYGEGTAVFASQARFEGNWANGKPDGEGTYTTADGTAYRGTWTNGCFRQGSVKLNVNTSARECGF